MDILSELLLGLRNTLVFGLTAAAADWSWGSSRSGFAWFGGLVDQVLMRLADIVLAVPAVMILILLAAFFRPSPTFLALTLAGLAWPTTAKAIRAQALVSGTASTFRPPDGWAGPVGTSFCVTCCRSCSPFT